ncbi:uncharacterized protein TNCV_3390311 [Trichonephila clavipes]|nr:uncharacterized protein TNCV_3390311 [Trichonephila clavipes]
MHRKQLTLVSSMRCNESYDVGREKQSRSSQAHMYSKTKVVLSWLSSPPRNWKPFVANRISEILDMTPCKQWRYVPSKENPADLGSRGMSPKDLPDCSLWWEGPQWLTILKKPGSSNQL